MASSRRWDRASLLPIAADSERRPEIVQLGAVLPDVPTLFTFMRDAELRFATLRLRLDERTWAANGERLRVHDILVRHRGRARVTIREEGAGSSTGRSGGSVAGPRGDYDAWASDGSTIRTWRQGHRLATERPVRSRVVGLEDPDLPGMSRAYRPLTALPANSPADTFVHPAGLCQNVLATGTCTVTGTALIAGREAVTLTCVTPRTIELSGDRPDHRIEIAVDREAGILVALREAFGDRATRSIIATDVSFDTAIPDSAFVIAIPSDAASIY